jgi:hypothetical protein
VNVPLPPRPGTWPSRLVQLAIVIVVAAVMAGTFVLSYSGVHAIALQSGVSASLARYYPGVFDAVLVIACAAAPIPGVRWWTRLYTWLVILIVIGLLGTMDAVHAMNVALPRRQVAGAVAVLPWGLLLLAFSLWLAILRHFRVQQSPQATPVAPAAEVTVETVGVHVIEAAPGVLPALPALPAAAPLDEAVPDDAVPDKAVPDDAVPDKAVPDDAVPDDAVPDKAVPDKAVPDDAVPDDAVPDDAVPGPEADLIPGLAAEGAAQAPEADRPAGALDSPEPESPEPEGLLAQSQESLDADPWDAADPGDRKDAPAEVTEVGGTPYATGPRLRRIRSLPAAPVDDDE